MNLSVLHKISYGLYIISSHKNGKFNGQIANVVSQLTSEPPSIGICINKQNLTHEFIQNSKTFTISILEQDTPMTLIGKFGFKSGRDTDKFQNTKYKIGKTNAPIVLDNTIGYIEAEVINSIDVGTHTLFVGKIIDAEVISDAEPMTYAYYHQVKRGKSPKTAPTYIKEDEIKKREVKTMDRYICSVCGYVYDPQKGDPESGIKPNTPFEALPDDWVCPVCGAGKDQFEKEA